MSEHGRRIREHMRIETELLQKQAERARLFDHHGNRGSEAEHALLSWLARRFAPGYVVCAGEVIDSFDTDPELDSRQQDGIIHRNDPDANAFPLPSGMRLVPIESVAALVESKLRLDRAEFAKADIAANATSHLRIRVGNSVPIGLMSRHVYEDGMFSHVRIPRSSDEGLPVHDPRWGPNRITFAVFGFSGVTSTDVLEAWVRDASTINLACSLDAGCVWRLPGSDQRVVVGKEDALAAFAHALSVAIEAHDVSMQHLVMPPFGHYRTFAAEPGPWGDKTDAR